MCGIAGIADLSGRPIDESLVRRMCTAICHRGPDDEGLLAVPAFAADGEPRAVLGNRRLSIIDLAGGHQPMSNEDGSIWTVQNGEIYNFQAVRRRLERNGHHFRTNSDTEVIVHLYEELGPTFVRELDGMFAIAIWDGRAKRLVLARDRFGKKPLVYTERDQRLWFASELQALLTDAAIPREIDLEALDEYLSFMAVPAPLTIYRGVHKLPPAHVLVADATGTTITRYWSLAFTPKRQISEADAADEVKRLFTEAVRKRLISDVPLGAFLSGGVDSSAVVATMAALTTTAVKTFSIGFDEARYNELPHARRVAERYGCEHHQFQVRPSALEVLPTLVRHYGEPYADSSAIPSFYLAKLTRQHVTVALNGDGGDEIFAGYRWHLAGRLAERWQQVPVPARQFAESFARAITPQSADRRSTATRAMRFLAGASRPRPAQYRAWLCVFTEPQKRELYAQAIGPFPDRLAEAFAHTRELDGVDAMLSADVSWYLPTDLLVKMDIATMAHSLEARSPFLDRDLAEFVATLPTSYKVRGRQSKYILKRALTGMVPDENMHRPKQGFAVPLAAWFRGELRDYVRDHLLSERFHSRGLFNRAAVRRLVDDHQQRRGDYAHHLWVLLMLELWFREYLDC